MDLNALGAISERVADERDGAEAEVLEIAEISRFKIGAIKGFTFFPEPGEDGIPGITSETEEPPHQG